MKQKHKFASLLFAFALIFGDASDSSAGIDIWPLYEKTEESTTVLYPFFVREDPFLMAFPFYYRTNEGQDHHVLWPLVKVSDGRLVRVAPVWFSNQEGEFTVFPLMRQTGDSTFWLIPPVYQKHDEDFFALFPLFAKSPEQLYIFPSIYRSTTNGTDFRVFPIYRYRKNENSELLRILNYHHHENGYSETSALIPIYWHRTAGESESSLLVFPYHGFHSPTEERLAVYPLFDHGTRDEGDSTREWLSVLWPLYKRSVTQSDSGEVLRRYRRFALFSESYDKHEGRRFKLVGIPIAERTK